MLTNKLTGFFYEENCLSQVLCMTDHLIIQLTYPEFHFEIETEVDSLTGLQRYEGDYFEWILTILKHTLHWTLNSLEDNFQLEMRLRFFNKSYVQFMQFEICLSSKKIQFLLKHYISLTRLKEHHSSTDSKFAHGCNYSKIPGK